MDGTNLINLPALTVPPSNCNVSKAGPACLACSWVLVYIVVCLCVRKGGLSQVTGSWGPESEIHISSFCVSEAISP